MLPNALPFLRAVTNLFAGRGEIGERDPRSSLMLTKKLHTTRVQEVGVHCTRQFVQRVHEGKNGRTNNNLFCTCQFVQRVQSAKHHARTPPTQGGVQHVH